MNLNPTARAILGAVSVGLVALSTALAAYETIPAWVGIVITVVLAITNFLLAPSQLGGTQQGLVNPTLTEPPPADIEPPQRPVVH